MLWLLHGRIGRAALNARGKLSCQWDAHQAEGPPRAMRRCISVGLWATFLLAQSHASGGTQQSCKSEQPLRPQFRFWVLQGHAKAPFGETGPSIAVSDSARIVGLYCRKASGSWGRNRTPFFRRKKRTWHPEDSLVSPLSHNCWAMKLDLFFFLPHIPVIPMINSSSEPHTKGTGWQGSMRQHPDGKMGEKNPSNCSVKMTGPQGIMSETQPK